MLRAIAIDDEPPALEVIGNMARQVPFLALTACFTRALAALDHLRSEQVDLMFLDIRMPDISGIDFMRSLAEPPMVIFTTAFSEHAVQSFELDAVDYLLKPFSLSRFLKACNKADALLALRRQVILQGAAAGAGAFFIKNGYEQVKVNAGDILLVESMGNYVRFVLKDRFVTSRLTMDQAAALLPAGHFIRTSRGFLVAVAHITKIEKGSVWVGSLEAPVGDRYRADVERLFLK